MPYISAEARDRLMQEGEIPSTPGELNFLLTMICLEYEKRNGNIYSVYNDIVGALEGCKLEFYRRVVGPYEEQKIKMNGDCYGKETSVSGEPLL